MFVFLSLCDRDSSDKRLDRFKKFCSHYFVHKILVEFINRQNCCFKYRGHFKILNNNYACLEQLIICENQLNQKKTQF